MSIIQNRFFVMSWFSLFLLATWTLSILDSVCPEIQRGFYSKVRLKKQNMEVDDQDVQNTSCRIDSFGSIFTELVLMAL